MAQFADFEPFMRATEPWAQALAERDTQPDGTAQAVIDYETHEVPYWHLRDSKYGSIEPIQSDCEIVNDLSQKRHLIYAIVHSQVVTQDRAEKWLSYDPEWQQLVISGLGKIAVLTEHTHLKPQPYKNLHDLLGPIDIIDEAAVRDGYTPEMAMNDFVTDIAKHRVLSSKSGGQSRDKVLSLLRRR